MKLVELYKEGSKSIVDSNGKHYLVDDLIEQSENNEIIKFHISDLDWIIDHTEIDEARVKKADLSIPILVYNDVSQPNHQQLVVLDGAHRLTKAKRKHHKTIKGKLLSDKQVEKSEKSK